MPIRPGQFLAALLDWPQATFASRLELLGGEIRVDRETDHGIETLRLPLPAVVTTDLRLNEPRYASLAGIMKAKKKPLDVIADEELGVPIEPRVEVLRYHSADTQRRCERVASVDELRSTRHRGRQCASQLRSSVSMHANSSCCRTRWTMRFARRACRA